MIAHIFFWSHLRLLGALATNQILDGEPSEVSAVELFFEREAQAIRRAENMASAGAPEQALMLLRGTMDDLPLSFDLPRSYLETAWQVDGRHDIVGDYVRERMEKAALH